MKKLFIILLFVVISVANVANANVCLKNIINAIEKNSQNSPSVGIIIVHNGETIYKYAGGLVDIDDKMQTTTSTPLSLCSMSKQITAQAILQLEEQGLLNINDKVTKYIKWLPKYAKNVRILNLIYHNSGIADYMNDNIDLNKMTIDEMMHQNVVVDEALIKNYIINTKQNFKTGAKWQYSNSGYWLLARIIEQVSGMSYSDYISKNVFQKINAKNSYVNFNNTKNIEVQQHKTWPLYTKLPSLFATLFPNTDGDGGIFMSIDDYENYIKLAFLNGGLFQKNETYKKFMHKGFKIEDNKFYGYGLVHSNTGKYKTIAHDGGHIGYNSQIMYYPEKDLVVAMFFGTNTMAAEFLPDDIVRCF
jgi:CubicO group peptidase (beta-lactamase class C family)